MPPAPRYALAILLAALLSACATPAPEPRKADLPSCPPAEKPVCPAPPTVAVAPSPSPSPAPEPAPIPEVEYRGRLQQVAWADLPDWGRETLRESLVAFSRGCAELAKLDAWKVACAAAASVPPSANEREVAAFFTANFDPHQVINADETTAGIVTGYYEPLLRGSRHRTATYRYPIYAVPQDLVVIDLATVYPDLKHKRLRGRLDGNRVVPYYARGDIDREDTPLKGLEIAWVDDPIELFFLHIQGSGQVRFENGESLRVGYAEQNGHPFRSVARLLIQKRELPAERTSLQGMKDWARRHPKKVKQYLDANPSYVFFKVLESNLPGPIGSLGVPLTAERSIAVDPRVIPLGVPVYLATTFPGSPRPLNRLMVAQDTGGAINGGVRADFFWGFGDEAGALAGRMKQSGRLWVLLPKGYAPPTLVPTGAAS
ncbi:MAG: MltA domain-containing protein [Betaproteobacteria bacterium]|nr:MltA domain-containing protein [Betaproteobacteria bacterium]